MEDDKGINSTPHICFQEVDVAAIKEQLKMVVNISIEMKENIDKPYDNFQNIRWLLKMKGNGQVKLNCVESILDMLVFINTLNPIYLELNLSPTELYHVLQNKTT